VTLLRFVLAVLGGVLAAAVLANAIAYAGAAAYRRRHARRCIEDEPPPWPARVLASSAIFTGECLALALVLLATPLAAWRARSAPAAGRRPIVLVHGYGLHAASFVALARRLRRDGWPHVHAVTLVPLGGDIERSARRLGAAIDRIRAASGTPQVDVVAHGMGGLVARAYVRGRGRASGIGRLLTIGTPHQGTHALAWLAFDPMVRQMRPGSPLMTRLLADDPVPALADCTAIASAHDARVVPPDLAYWPGAFNVEVQRLGHVSLLFSARVYELVRENLEAPAPARIDAAL
jgi:pimeloyl-ACP methyl ester carboxylesterase